MRLARRLIWLAQAFPCSGSTFLAETNHTGERPSRIPHGKSPGKDAEAQHPTTQTGEGSYSLKSVIVAIDMQCQFWP